MVKKIVTLIWGIAVYCSFPAYARAGEAISFNGPSTGETITIPATAAGKDSNCIAEEKPDKLQADQNAVQTPAKPSGKDTIPIAHVEDEITFFDPLDTLTNSLFRACYKFNQPKPNKFGFDTSYVPIYPDEVIIRDMAKIPSVVPLVYNQWVKAFIYMYSVQKRDQVRRMLGLSEMYFPIFEEVLDRHKMPLELKYLAIVESALNPNAVSKAGATGLWQLMYSTGKFLNMEIHSYIDERRDPYKATDAAITYLGKLYDIYGDWMLVIAAYNCGPGNVNKAIKRSGGKTNFWEIKPYLPKETQGYVPAYIAAMYVLHYYEDFNFQPEPCGFSFNATDTIIIKDAITLQQIADAIQLDVNELIYLNPSLTKHYIPATQTGYALKLPINKVALFVEKKDSIFKSIPSATEILEANSAMSERVRDEVDEHTVTTKKYHVVKPGESMARIAAKYKVTTAQIKKWNGLKSTTLKTGQKLKILVATTKVTPRHGTVSHQNAEEEKVSQVKYVAPAKVSGKDLALISYTVEPGDNFTLVCRSFGCTAEEIRKWNHLASQTLNVGEKLNIYVPSKDLDKYVDAQPEAADAPPATNDNNVTTDSDPSPKPHIVYYTVRAGDNLWEISKKFPGITVEQIKRANNLGGGKTLQVGMKLKIEL